MSFPNQHAERPVGTIHRCVHCGETCGGKYCGMCGTAEGRKKVTEGNEAIRRARAVTN